VKTRRLREKLHGLVRLRFFPALCHVGLGDVSNDEGQQTSTRSEGRGLPKGWRVLQKTGGLQRRAFWMRGAGWNFDHCAAGIHPRRKRMLHCLPTARAASIARFSPCGAGPKRENDRRQPDSNRPKKTRERPVPKRASQKQPAAFPRQGPGGRSGRQHYIRKMQDAGRMPAIQTFGDREYDSGNYIDDSLCL
jgi:hypothetical protein